MEICAHKFAILDIAQRLPHDRRRFEAIAKQLGVAQQRVEEIYSTEDVPEERYYQVRGVACVFGGCPCMCLSVCL